MNKNLIKKGIGVLVVVGFVFAIPLYFSNQNSSVQVSEVEAGVKKIGKDKYKVSTRGKTVYVKTKKGTSHALSKARNSIEKGKVGKGCRNVTKNPGKDWKWNPNTKRKVGNPPKRPPTGGGGRVGSGSGGGGGSTVNTAPPATGVPGTVLDNGYYDENGLYVEFAPVSIGDFRIESALTNDQCTLFWTSQNATSCELVKNGTDRISVGLNSGTTGHGVSSGRYQLYCENRYSGDSVLTDPPLVCRTNIDFRET